MTDVAEMGANKEARALLAAMSPEVKKFSHIASLAGKAILTDARLSVCEHTTFSFFGD